MGGILAYPKPYPVSALNEFVREKLVGANHGNNNGLESCQGTGVSAPSGSVVSG